jgi:hypothetical protein
MGDEERTKDRRQTSRKLRSGGVGAQMETHNSYIHSSEFIIYSGKPGGGTTVLGGGGGSVTL